LLSTLLVRTVAQAVPIGSSAAEASSQPRCEKWSMAMRTTDNGFRF
jgi:hypothetical protein